MTEATGTVKGHALLRTRCIVENVTPNEKGAIISLRPEWDESIRENQLAVRGETNRTFALTVPLDSKMFFETGKPVYLEFTKG